MTGSTRAGDGAVVARSKPVPHVARVLFRVGMAIVAAGWVVILVAIATGDTSRYTEVFAVILPIYLIFMGLQHRGYALRLGDEELVMRYPLHTRRVPYAEITGVHGDVPNHVAWSSKLLVERREGRALTVAGLERPLEEIRDLIIERVEADRRGVQAS